MRHDDMRIDGLSGPSRKEMPSYLEIPVEGQEETANEAVAKQIDQEQWSFDDTRDVMVKSEHLQKAPKTKNESLSSRTELGKVGKAKQAEYPLSAFFRKDLSGFAFSFSQKFFKYTIPEKTLQQMLSQILASILTKDLLVRRDKAPVPMPYALLRQILLGAKEAGVDDPAQIDKIFEFLLEATKIEESMMDADGVENILLLRENLERARLQYTNTHGKDIQSGHRLINVVSAVVEDSKQTEKAKDTKEILTNMRELIASPMEVAQAVRKYEAMGYTMDMMDREVDVMFKHLNPELKDNRKENPELFALIRTVRNLQAFRGLKNFMKKGMKLVVEGFSKAA